MRCSGLYQIRIGKNLLLVSASHCGHGRLICVSGQCSRLCSKRDQTTQFSRDVHTQITSVHKSGVENKIEMHRIYGPTLHQKIPEDLVEVQFARINVFSFNFF